jgi:hypothetical protein
MFGLFVTEDGTPMSVAMLRGWFDLAREAAGVSKFEFQMRDLRQSRHGQGGVKRRYFTGQRSTWAYDRRNDRAVHPQSKGEKGLSNKVNCGPDQ